MSVELAEPLFERALHVAPALGPLRAVATRHALVAILFQQHEKPHRLEAQLLEPATSHPILDRAERELREYVEGTRRSFEIPLAPRGTAFQRAVWSALGDIPLGETRTYAEVAAAIGRPRAVRAVGAANALNPLSILVPCHRVIGKDGELTGYAGGLERKAWLLAHERRPKVAQMPMVSFAV